MNFDLYQSVLRFHRLRRIPEVISLTRQEKKSFLGRHVVDILGLFINERQ